MSYGQYEERSLDIGTVVDGTTSSKYRQAAEMLQTHGEILVAYVGDMPTALDENFDLSLTTLEQLLAANLMPLIDNRPLRIVRHGGTGGTPGRYAFIVRLELATPE